MAQLISIGYGKETFSTSSVSLMSFVVKPGGFLRTLPNRTFKRQGSVQAFPASNLPDINGMLYQDTLEAEEGSLMLFQSSHTYHGARMRDAAFFLELRTDGPMHVIKAQLPADRNALNSGKFLIFQGRGDIISCSEAITLHGLELPRNFEKTYFNPEEIAECFFFQVTEQGRERPKLEKLEMADGTEAVFRSTKRGRRVKIR